ncbi:Ig-like domain-containing protein [Cytophagales bacterium LB-30]|uniref:Ig-like domain-containing protein n=1 Tax=Shiella aurantiaca TaxID=3058365 RepID=A0ABT8F3Y3_9BACT|nr:Ig-like domain-containing protein [Shiella aurantiaca]MDN4165110.1 Ig-like domain-containing protein [Shiella aurantiaca]
MTKYLSFAIWSILLILASSLTGWAQTAPGGVRSINYARIGPAPIIRDMHVDTQGNIFVAGIYNGDNPPTLDPFTSQLPEASADGVWDVYVAKYDGAGVLQWLRSGVSESAELLNVSDIAVDASGNVYVSGTVRGDYARFYDADGSFQVQGSAFNSVYSNGAYVLRYTSNGEISHIWNKHFEGQAGSYSAMAMVLNGSDIYVAGQETGNTRAYIAKLNTSLAEQSYNPIGTGNIEPRDMVRDANGAFYLTGSVKSTVSLGGSQFTATSQGDVYVAKYSSAYTYSWGFQVSSQASTEYGTSIAVNANGDVFLLAQVNGLATTIINKYNSMGNLQAGNISLSATGTSPYVKGEKLLIDNDGNLFVLGRFRGTSDLDPGAGTTTVSDANGGYFWAGYTNSLAFSWRSPALWNNSVNTSITGFFDSFNKYHVAFHYDYSGNQNGYLASYSFESDRTAPAFTNRNPADGSSNVARNANLEITFNEAVQASPSASISIKNYSTNEVIESFTLPSPRVSIVDNVVTIDPTTDFPLTKTAQRYYVNYTGFRDAAGNFSNAIQDKNTWEFLVTFDNTAPTVSSFLPAQNAVDASVSQNLQITFSEPVFEITDGFFRLYKTSGGELIETFTLPSARVVTNGNTVTIDPSNDLEAGTQYYLGISSNTMRDEADNRVLGNLSSSFWTFTTADVADTQAPVLSNLSPLDNATEVAPSSNLTLTFDENISGVESKTLSLRLASNNGVVENFTLPSAAVTIEANQVTINPSADLASSIGYYVLIDAGTFEDAAGNDFAGIASTTAWNFTTAAIADIVAPTISTLSPSNGAVDVALDANLQITFSEPVVPVTDGLIQLIRKASGGVMPGFNYSLPHPNVTVSGNVVTINWEDDMLPTEEFWVYLKPNSFEDAAGNNAPGYTTEAGWAFTTVFVEDNTNPILVNVSPVVNATGVAVNSPIHLYFSEFVQLNAGGTISLNYIGAEMPIEQYTLPSDRVYVSGAEVSIYPTNNLPNGKQIYLNVSNNAISDYQLNYYEGVSDATSITFTTVASAAPTLTAVYPNTNSTNVPVGVQQMKMVTNETVYVNEASGGSVDLYTLDGTLVSSLTAAELGSGYTENSFFFNTILAPSTTYYITVSADLFRTNGGGSFAGISDNTTWRFSTQSAEDSYSLISSFSPAHGATQVSESLSEIRLDFTQEVNADSGKFRLRKQSDNSLVKEWDLNTDVTFNSVDNYAIFPLDIVLEPNTTYYIDNSFDNSGNYDPGLLLYEYAYDAGLDIYTGAYIAPWATDFWTFTTGQTDNVAPTIVSVTPSQNTTGVSINPEFIIEFSEEVVINDAGFDFVRLYIFPTLIETVQLRNTELVTFEGNLVKVRFSAPLEYSTQYLFGVTSQMVKDLAGNPNQANANITFFTEAHPDTDAPLVTSLYPSNGASKVPFDTVYTMHFNELIALDNSDTKYVKLYNQNDELVHQVLINASNLQVGEDGQSVTMKFNANEGQQYFNLGTSYYILVDEGGIKDLYDNPLASLQSVSDWAFTIQTREEAYEVYTDFSPARGAVEVPISVGTLQMTYNQPVVKSGSGAYRLKDANGNLIKEWASDAEEIVVNNEVVSITNVPELAYSTSYFVEHVGPYSAFGGDITWGSVYGLNSFRLLHWRQDASYWTFTTEAAPKAAQSITFEALPTKTFGDAAFDLTATASSGLEVSYSSSDETVATINGSTLTIVGAGTATITASQAGDADYEAAASVGQVLTVNKATQSITFNALSTKTFGDAAFGLSATASSGLAVSYSSSDESVATINGTALTIIGAGTATITASQSGNANYEAATSVEQVLTVNKANQTISIESIADKSISDDPFEIIATSTSGLSLSYAILSGPATIEGNVISLNGSSGTVALEVSQAGNANYNAASAQTSFAVLDDSKTNQSITFAALEDKTYGDAAFTLSATASSGLEVVYSSSDESVATISGNTLTIQGAGSALITATQSGNDSFNPASAVSQSLTVNAANLTLTVDDKSITYGEALPEFTYQLTGFVNGEDASVLTQIPQISSTATANSDAGSYEITANGAEAANYTFTYEAGTLTINKANQTINITTIAQQNIDAGTITVEATASSGLEVSFTVLSGPATVVGNQLTLSGTPGTVVLEASQAGNQNYEAASAQTSFTVIDPANPCEGFAVSLLSQTDNLCAGEANGAISVTVTGGTEPYAYSWSNGGESQNLSSLAAGDYTLTVTDANECTVSLSVSITEPSALVVSFTTQAQTDADAPNGSIDLTVSGGTSPYTYAWSNEATEEDLSGLTAGDYNVTITDANGCSISQNITVAEDIEVVSGIAENAFQVKAYPNPCSEYLSIEWEGNEVKTLRLLSLQGQMVQEHRLSGQQQYRLDVSKEQAGIYLLQIATGSRSQILKIRIEK